MGIHPSLLCASDRLTTRGGRPGHAVHRAGGVPAGRGARARGRRHGRDGARAAASGRAAPRRNHRPARLHGNQRDCSLPHGPPAPSPLPRRYRRLEPAEPGRPLLLPGTARGTGFRRHDGLHRPVQAGLRLALRAQTTPPPPAGTAGRADTDALFVPQDQESEFMGTTQDTRPPLVDFKVSWFLSNHLEPGHVRLTLPSTPPQHPCSCSQA